MINQGISGYPLCFITMLLPFSGCGIFQKTTKSSSTLNSGSKVVRFYSDSSSYDKEVLIWPKGNFSYSPGTGFFGEAEKVQLKVRGSSGARGSEVTTRQSSAEEKVMLKEPKLRWGLLVLICGVGIYLSFKFFKKWQF